MDSGELAQEVNKIFEQVLQMSEPDRSTFVELACHGDPTLRNHVLQLLAEFKEVSDDAISSPVKADPRKRRVAHLSEFIGNSRFSVERHLGAGAFGCSLPGVERRFHAQLWKALPCGTADLDRVRRVGSQRDCRQTNGEEATDEMEPAHCPEFPRCSHSCAEWHLGTRISTLAPGFPANRGTAPGRGRSVITPQLCMLSSSSRKSGLRYCTKSLTCESRRRSS